MTSKKNSNTSSKKSEEKKAEKLLKSANNVKTQLQQSSTALASASAAGNTPSTSLQKQQQTIDKYLDNITIFADKVVEMWKNKKIDTAEYRELIITMNNYISLARTFRGLIDEQRKLLMIKY